MGYGRINAYHALGGPGSSTPWYSASMYLWDSKTILSTYSGTGNSVAKHIFADASGGRAEFRLFASALAGKAEVSVAGDTRKAVLTGAPFGGSTSIYEYSGSLSGYANAGHFDPVVYIPSAVLTDTKGVKSHIPLPAYTVPGEIPAALKVISKPKYCLVPGSGASVSVGAVNAKGARITGVPLTATLAAYPAPSSGKSGPSLLPLVGRTGGTSTSFSADIRMSSSPGDHLVVFSMTVEGYEDLEVSVTVTGNLPPYVKRVTVTYPGTTIYNAAWVEVDTVPTGLRFVVSSNTPLKEGDYPAYVEFSREMVSATLAFQAVKQGETPLLALSEGTAAINVSGTMWQWDVHVNKPTATTVQKVRFVLSAKDKYEMPLAGLDRSVTMLTASALLEAAVKSHSDDLHEVTVNVIVPDQTPSSRTTTGGPATQTQDKPKAANMGWERGQILTIDI